MEEKLIELVKEKPILWDIKSKGYKLVHLKIAVWDEIGAKIGMNGEKARKRFKSLRDYYRSQKANKLKSGSAAGDVPTWKYFHLMKFLDDSMEPRKTHTITEDHFFEENDSYFDYIIEESNETSNDVATNPLEILQQSTPRTLRSTPEKSQQSVPLTPTTSYSTPAKKNKRKMDEVIEDAQNQFAEVTRIFKSAIEKPKTEVRAFFESIAVQIESACLEKENWLELQEKVFNETIAAIRKNKEQQKENYG